MCKVRNQSEHLTICIGGIIFKYQLVERYFFLFLFPQSKLQL